MNHIEYTNKYGHLKIKCSFYNHSNQMLYTLISIYQKIFCPDGSQHNHVCTSHGRLVFPIHQLELLVERILNEINEFHLTFTKEASVVILLLLFLSVILFYLFILFLFILIFNSV